VNELWTAPNVSTDFLVPTEYYEDLICEHPLPFTGDSEQICLLDPGHLTLVQNKDRATREIDHIVV